MANGTYTLTSASGDRYESETPGELGGNRRTRIYGRLDCATTLKTMRRGGYTTHRVFFADEETAVAAGYRPCPSCMKSEYDAWKAERVAEG